MGDISINWNSQLPYVDANLAWFQEQITQETNDGSLTTDEQTTVNDELTQIQQLESTDEQGGTVTTAEQKQLWQDLYGMNRDLYSLTHNALGVTESESPNGRPTPLITPENYWEHPAVNTDPDGDGDNDYLANSYLPYYSPFGNYGDTDNDPISGAPPPPLFPGYGYYGGGFGCPPNYGFGYPYSGYDYGGYNAGLNQFEAEESNIVNQNSGINLFSAGSSPFLTNSLLGFAAGFFL